MPRLHGKPSRSDFVKNHESESCIQTGGREAHDWYEEQQFGIGGAFLGAVESTITRIETMPKMYAIVLRSVRRAKVRTFPYLIYYRLLDDRIEVIGVLHGSRNPKLWRERIN